MPEFYESLGVHESPIRVLASGDIVDPTVDIPDGTSIYGYQAKGYPRPELLAPRDDEAGGFLLFGNNTPPEFVDGLIAVAGLASNQYRRRDQYAVQVIDAPAGQERELGYLRKLVIADRFALRFLFNSISESEYESMPKQPVDIAELVKAFMDDERKKYGTHFDSPLLSGKFGGDGYFGREELSFGFSIENMYYGVASVWSRAWLVTK